GSRSRSPGSGDCWTADPRRPGGTRPGRNGSVDVFVELLAAMESAGNVVRLTLRANGRSVCGEGARGGEREDAVACQLVLAVRGLDALDRVEVAILSEQRLTECGMESTGLAARSEIARDEFAGLVHLLLPVEQRR